MSGGVGGQSSRSVCPFTGIHLWRPAVPALFLFFSLLLPSQLSCQAAPENREFLSVCGLFEPFQSTNEAPQTPKLETIRKVTKHVGERENLLTQKRGARTSSDITAVCSQLASYQNRLSVAPCRPSLIMPAETRHHCGRFLFESSIFT